MASFPSPVIYHKRIKFQRLTAARTCGEQAQLIPRFGGEVEAGGLVRGEIGVTGNAFDLTQSCTSRRAAVLWFLLIDSQAIEVDF